MSYVLGEDFSEKPRWHIYLDYGSLRDSIGEKHVFKS